MNTLPASDRTITTDVNAQQTHRWLVWLHSKLKHDNTTFLIESMQPEWLDPQQKRLYHICVGLTTGLAIALIYGMSTW